MSHRAFRRAVELRLSKLQRAVHSFVTSRDKLELASHTIAAVAVLALVVQALYPVIAKADEIAGVIVTKQVVGSDVAASSFTINVSGTNVSNPSFPGDSAGTLVLMSPGSFSVSETDPGPDYTVSYQGDCEGTIANDEVLLCTVINTYNPQPTTGEVTIIKQVDNLGEQGAEYYDFNLFVGDEPVVHNVAESFAPGDYIVSEQGPLGYSTVFTGDCDESGNLTVEAGQSYTCTITNTLIPPGEPVGDLEICKYYDYGTIGQYEEGTDTPLAWDMTVEAMSGGSQGSIWYTGTNGETGCVTLAGLPVGDYEVTEASESGWVRSYPAGSASQTATVSEGTTTTVVFLNYEGQAESGTIEVCKYEDTDGDSAPDGFIESTPINPLLGWTINITDGDQFSDSKVTGENGCVQFTDLPYTAYTITETMQPGWVKTMPGADSIVIDLDASYNWAYFLNHQESLYSVHGYKWDDENGNGERDCSLELERCEPKLSGWTIFLDENDNGLFDDGETFMLTDDSQEHFGWYWFEGLPPGDYSICEVQQAGWTQTYPEKGCHEVTLPQGLFSISLVSENAVIGPEYNFGNQYTGGNGEMCTGSGTYTVDADFDQGSLINVNHNPSDQLQLSENISAFNFIWVAVSTKGTVVKINTDTGAIVGEYRTTPSAHGNGDPSRTTVDKDGSVWLSNRSNVYEGVGSVIHIGLVENNQCEDRNSNGIIDTSTAQNDIKPWTDASGDRSVATAEDECIIHYVKLPNASGTRHVSVNSDNDVWVAGYYSKNFDLIKGGGPNVPGSGTIIRSEPSVGYGGYGGLIDKNGVIWSAANLLRWDTANPLTGPNGGNWTGYDHSSYGLCIDSLGNIYNPEYGPTVYKHAPDGTYLGSFPNSNAGYSYAQGCVVDKNDHLWVAGSLSDSVVHHLLTDGTFIGDVPVGSGPTGVAVDANGKIWATNYYSGTVSRIDPALGPIGGDAVTPVGAVDFTSVGLGGSPYNYSDMTGSTLSGMAESGTWTVVHDGQVASFPWKNVTWNADVPDGANLSVTVAASTDGVTFGPPQAVTSGQDLSSISDRYLKVVVTFNRSEAGASPVLYDLSVNRDCGEEPVDMCSNLEGVQEQVPSGYTESGGVCTQTTSTGGGGGGGGGSFYQLIISNEQLQVAGDSTSMTITWETNHPATSRVVYDTVSHPVLGSPTMYGYAFTTTEDSTLTTSHSVTISGLTSGTPYYFRPVSHGSPETTGIELAYTPPGGSGTPGVAGAADTGAGATPQVLGAVDTLPRTGGMPEALLLTWLAPFLKRRKAKKA